MTTPKIPVEGNSWDDGTEHSVRHLSAGKFTVEILPEGYILLQKELSTSYHPKLQSILNGIGLQEIDERLIACATYAGIALDGFYTIQERSVLAAMIAGRLELLRELKG